MQKCFDYVVHSSYLIQQFSSALFSPLQCDYYSYRFGEVLWKPGHYGQPSAGLWNLSGLPEQGVWDGSGPGPCNDRCGSGHFGNTRIYCGGEAGPSENRLACYLLLILVITADVLGSVWLIVYVSSGEKFKAVLLRMSQLASSGATELRVRSLDAISDLLTLQVCVCTYIWRHFLCR